jgi:hypothetical protein
VTASVFGVESVHEEMKDALFSENQKSLFVSKNKKMNRTFLQDLNI